MKMMPQVIFDGIYISDAAKSKKKNPIFAVCDDISSSYCGFDAKVSNPSPQNTFILASGENLCKIGRDLES